MALKLIVENDKNDLQVYDFDGELITVGRDLKNDLVLDERNISRRHFQLEMVDGRIIISDSNSFNHTFVDDREISDKTEIFVGDIITVGDYNIYLEQEDSINLEIAPAAVESQRTVATENLLLAKNGYIGGKTFPLSGAETVIGSHAGADVHLFGNDIPPLHSKLIFDGNVFFLVKGNYQGDYPLIVNDMEINSVDMRNGDEIKVCDFVFEFVEKGAEYDPLPYQIIAEKARKEKLRKDLKSNKIKSIRDEEEFIEITQVRPQSPPKSKIKIIILVVVAALLLVLGFIFFS